jgi:hypothetical protein
LIEQHVGSLYDLDRTDIESLFPFFFYLAERARQGDQERIPTRRVYADQADWM